MQYLKKSFDKLKNNDKLSAINELIKNLSDIRDNINSNSNGNILLSYIELYEEDMKEKLDELKEESKLIEDYSKKEIEEMKQNIKKIKEKLKIYNEIENINVSKEKEFDPNEGWNTTCRNIIIEINLNGSIKIKLTFCNNYNGYDGSTDNYKYIYIYKNDVKLELNKDYYKEDGKYYNGKKIKNDVNTLNNFQEKLQQHCKDNNIDFEKLSTKELAKLMKDNLNNSKKLKKEINEHQKNKNTPWTFLVNRILEELEDEDKFLELFDMIDN